MNRDNHNERLTNLSPAKRALLELRLTQGSIDPAAVGSIPRRADRDAAPLSFAQQRLWFLNQLEPESPVYNESTAIRLYGCLNVKALEKALHHIIERHEVLRTTIATLDGTPRQLITKKTSVDFPLTDLRGWPGADRDAEAQRLMVEAIRRPFDLSRDLMLRIMLLRLDEQEHVLLVVKHHIASDGWSWGILWRELSALYKTLCKGEALSLPELPVQYADYAVWQRNWLQGDVLERQLLYWKQQLSDALPLLAVPTDYSRAGSQNYQGASQSLELPPNLTATLNAFNRREGVTLFMTLLAAFQVLLARYSGQEDIVVGAPIANRNRTEIEGVIGFFVNTLVLRTDLSGGPTFREILGRVRKVALDAYDHQDLPFEKLVQELHPERSPGRNPLFEILLNCLEKPPQLVLPGLTCKEISLEHVTAKFPLTMYVQNS